MIVFLESDKNNFTVNLNPPIRAHKTCLVSCSLYNSLYKLIGGWSLWKRVPVINVRCSQTGMHYTPMTLAKELAKRGYTLTTGLPHKMTIKHDMANYSVTLGKFDALGSLFGIIGKTITNAAIPSYLVPSSYDVYCDLVHSYTVGPSHLMSKFPPKENPFDFLEYTPHLCV